MEEITMDQLSFGQLFLLYILWCTAVLVLKHIVSPWGVKKMFLLGFPVPDPKTIDRRAVLEAKVKEMHKSMGVVLPGPAVNMTISLAVTFSYFTEWLANLVFWPFSLISMFGVFIMVVGRKVPIRSDKND